MMTWCSRDVTGYQENLGSSTGNPNLEDVKKRLPYKSTRMLAVLLARVALAG
jgi:hypothetical protein